VLVTAFEPYDRWSENASRLCLVELTRSLPEQPELVTRRYPVDFARIRGCLEADLADNFDFAVHLGQAPGRTRLGLEAFAINAAHCPSGSPPAASPRSERLDEDGPTAYQTMLPLDDWADLLGSRGIPTSVSHHAGTYLCNAALYWSQRIAQLRGLRTQSLFIHVPLEPKQVSSMKEDLPSLSSGVAVAGLRLILEEMHGLVADV
jgi:pyroglutamyl-peptidase